MKPYLQMNVYRKYFIFALLCSIFSSSIHAQETQVDRDEYFRRLEQRALSLSKKFAEISGTEPVQLIPSQTQEASDGYVPPSPQQSYDALPGPSQEAPFEVSVDDTANNSVFLDDEIVVEKKPTMEDLRGEYFISPFFALQSQDDRQVTIGSSGDSLNSDLGYSLGLHAGIRSGDFILGLRLGYFYNEFANPDFENADPSAVTSVSGTSELLSLVATAGYSLPLNEKLSLSVGVAGGFGSQSDYLTTSTTIFGFADHATFSHKESSFTYELSAGIDYAFSENLSILVGYRLVGAGENGTFEDMLSHLFELGVGANF